MSQAKDFTFTPAEQRRILQERKQAEKQTQWAAKLSTLIDEMRADGCTVSINNLRGQGVMMNVNPKSVSVGFTIIDCAPVPLPQKEEEPDNQE